MMSDTAKLEFVASIYHSLEKLEIEDRLFFGVLPEEQDFSAACARLEEMDLLEESIPSSRDIGVRMPHSSQGFFAANISGLVKANQAKVPDNFYVANIDYYSHKMIDGDVPLEINGYYDVLKFGGILKNIADHEHRATDGLTHLIFLSDKKTTVVLDYECCNMQPVNGLDEFKREFCDSEQHVDQKNSIIKSSLNELLVSIDRHDHCKLSEVLSKFDIFVDKVRSSYELYISEFSFKKVRQEVEKEKLEFVVKINKVFSDIQNHLLAVPAALIFVGSKLESKDPFSNENILLLFGMFVFTVFMDLLVRNQISTLHALKDEIALQWKKIEDEHKSISKHFEDIYESLKIRLGHQRRLVRIVDFFVGASLIAIIVIWGLVSGLWDPFVNTI